MHRVTRYTEEDTINEAKHALYTFSARRLARVIASKDYQFSLTHNPADKPLYAEHAELTIHRMQDRRHRPAVIILTSNWTDCVSSKTYVHAHCANTFFSFADTANSLSRIMNPLGSRYATLGEKICLPFWIF